MGVGGVDPALLAHVALQRLLLGGAEEEAVEDQLEHATVLLRLGQGGGQRLPYGLALRPGDLGQRVERVEQLGGPHA